MTLNDLTELHEWYANEAGKGFSADYARSGSTLPHGVHALVRSLQMSKPSSIVEFGAGFSTLAIRRWAEESGSRHVIVDHDAEWLKFVQSLLRSKGLKDDNAKTRDEIKAESRMWGTRPFESAFIDHGDSMAMRWDDLPWIASIVRPDGVIYLDDYWPDHVRAYRSTKRLIRGMARMGFQLRVIPGSSPNEHAKSIVEARLR